MKKMAQEPPTLAFASKRVWQEWLSQNSGSQEGIWLKFAKKASGIPSVTYQEALEVALCHGWIDGQLRSLGADYFIQRFCPRRPRSKWSQVNCRRVELLIQEGKMTPAGMLQVELAKADGRWDQAYASPRNVTVPEDFRLELERTGLEAAFAALGSSDRYSILYRIHDAKRPETRQTRISKFVRALEDGTLVPRKKLS